MDKEFNRIKQCVKCNHYSAGGCHPCDPFCEKGQNANSKKPCSIYNKEHKK